VRKSVGAALAFLFVLAFLLPPPRATARVTEAAGTRQSPNPAAADSLFRQTNLVSDVPGLAPVLEPLLVNPWGLAKDLGPLWVANNGTNTSTTYIGDFAGSPFVPNASLRSITIPGGRPTGMVLNSSPQFTVTSGTATDRASAIFATLAGELVAYSNAVPAPGSRTGFVVASNPGSVYTGLALRLDTAPPLLFAADFANGKIDVYNTSYALTTVPGGFADATIPAGYAPHNIQNLGNSFYVTYAKIGAGNSAEAGVGKGYVRKFNPDGVRDPSFAIDAGPLNAPWGIGIAPEAFDPGFEDTNFGEKLVVGNYGEGSPSLHVFNPATGAFLGTLQDESGNAIRIDGLRGLLFAGFDPFGGNRDTLYFTAGLGDEQHGLLGQIKRATAAATSLIQFAGAEFSIGEGLGHADITVTRTGDLSGAATVNYNTLDQSGDGHASQKSDYEIALGTLSFAPGETSKTFRVLTVNDLFDEGAGEVLDLMLSNPTGAGVGLGSPNTAELTITDDDTGAPATNPIDTSSFFVRQHYLDFLNREPDASGLAHWTNEIESCGANAQCREVRRINVSAAFFLSIEFQETGFLAYRAHHVAFGGNAPGSPVPVYYGNFMRDTQALQRGFVFGEPGALEQLEANQVAYFNEFVTRPEFVTKYSSGLSNEQYVDALLASAGLTLPAGERQALIAGMDAGTETRATVVRKIAERQDLKTREFNRAFVAMQYFGYLRRDPDTAGFNFWLDKLNSFNGNFIQAEMVKAFINSLEYRQRFGPS
jgi:uncharacterized protein (TIGR03118 family)